MKEIERRKRKKIMKEKEDEKKKYKKECLVINHPHNKISSLSFFYFS